MKRFTALLFILGMILLSACSGNVMPEAAVAPGETAGISAATSSPSPKPTPTPEPPVRIAFFGGGADGLFVQGIAAEANKQGALIEAYLDTVAHSGGYDAVIVYASSEGELAGFVKEVPQGLPVVAYLGAVASSTTAPDSRTAIITYDAESEIQALYETAMAYPPHDTPVRLLGMFESAQSGHGVRFDELYEEGKVLPKGRYDADADEKTPEEWLASMLERYPEGTVDGIVVQSERLAQMALAVMLQNGRQDMEIFSGELSEASAKSMADNSELFVASVGENLAAAGRLCVLVALPMAKGANASSWIIPPGVAIAENIQDELWLASEGLMPKELPGLKG